MSSPERSKRRFPGKASAMITGAAAILDSAIGQVKDTAEGDTAITMDYPGNIYAGIDTATAKCHGPGDQDLRLPT